MFPHLPLPHLLSSLIVLLQANDKSPRSVGPKKKNNSGLSKNHYSDNHSPDSDLAVQKMKQELPSHCKDTKPIRQLPQFYFPNKKVHRQSVRHSRRQYTASLPHLSVWLLFPYRSNYLPKLSVSTADRTLVLQTSSDRCRQAHCFPFLHQRYMTSIHCLWQQRTAMQTIVVFYSLLSYYSDSKVLQVYIYIFVGKFIIPSMNGGGRDGKPGTVHFNIIFIYFTACQNQIRRVLAF